MLRSRGSLSRPPRIKVKKRVSSSTFGKHKCMRRNDTSIIIKKDELLNRLNELPDDGKNIFKKSIIYWYIDRANALFSSGKYSALNHICYAEFSAYCTINNQLDHSSEYQPDEFKNKLIEENHEECGYQKQIKLMKSQIKRS